MWLLQVILTIPVGIIEIIEGFLSKIKENTKQNTKDKRKNNINNTKYTMKLFNSIQIVAALTTSPIWLNFLKEATFTGAGPLFWLGCVISFVFFIWAIIGVASTMEG